MVYFGFGFNHHAGVELRKIFGRDILKINPYPNALLYFYKTPAELSIGINENLAPVVSEIAVTFPSVLNSLMRIKRYDDFG